MSVVLAVAAGYLIGRLAADLASTVAKVVMRHIVLGSPRWQERIRHDDELDAQLRRSVRR